jgi:hypothetical protein
VVILAYTIVLDFATVLRRIICCKLFYSFLAIKPKSPFRTLKTRGENSLQINNYFIAPNTRLSDLPKDITIDGNSKLQTN